MAELQRSQIRDGAIDDSKVASNADIQQSKIKDLATDLGSKVSLAGDTMTGSLILQADPVNSLDAATKQYVDNKLTNIQFDATAAIIPTRGFKLSKVDNSTLNISPGASKDSTGLNAIVSATPLNLALNSLAADTFYYIHLAGKSNFIGDIVGVSSLTSTPTLPSGYDCYKLIGAVKTDSSGNIMDFTVIGNGSIRRFTYKGPSTISVPVINSSTWTPMSLASEIPLELTQHALVFGILYGQTCIVQFRTGGSSSSVGHLTADSYVQSGGATGQLNGEILTDSSGNIEIINISGSGTSPFYQFFVKGFIFEI